MSRKYLLPLLASLALVAAACGDSSETTTATNAPATTTAPAATDAPTTEAPATTAVAEEPTTTTTEEMMENPDWPEKIVFGFVPSQEQDSLQDDIQPFIDVLESALGIEVEGVVTTDYTGLVTAMGTGSADLGAFGPFGYVLGTLQFDNIEPLIQSIRFGSATYHGQWFTSDPSICDEPPVSGTALQNEGGSVVQVDALEAVALQVGIAFGDDGKEFTDTTDEGSAISPGLSCFADLSKVEGKTVAFTGESSTSGYLFPALQLTALGLDPQGDVTALFTGGHDAAVTAVYNGDAEIGLSFDDARRTIREVSPDVGEKVIVFNITEEIPNDVVAVNSDLPDDLKEAIFTAVEAYLDTEEGEAVFDEIYGWTGIRRAVESDFDVVRTAAETLGITDPP